jgi:hypothetical protein
MCCSKCSSETRDYASWYEIQWQIWMLLWWWRINRRMRPFVNFQSWFSLTNRRNSFLISAFCIWKILLVWFGWIYAILRGRAYWWLNGAGPAILLQKIAMCTFLQLKYVHELWSKHLSWKDIFTILARKCNWWFHYHCSRKADSLKMTGILPSENSESWNYAIVSLNRIS